VNPRLAEIAARHHAGSCSRHPAGTPARKQVEQLRQQVLAADDRLAAIVSEADRFSIDGDDALRAAAGGAAAVGELVGKHALTDPQLAEAWRLAFPNESPNVLAHVHGARLEGYLASLKGKYFEVLLRDRLNAGHRVGNLVLRHGQVAALAKSPTQAGWDLVIRDRYGHVLQHIQARATDSLAYARHTLAANPKIPIFTTSEVRHGAHGVVTTHIANSAVSARVNDAAKHVGRHIGGEVAERIVVVAAYGPAAFRFLKRLKNGDATSQAAGELTTSSSITTVSLLTGKLLGGVLLASGAGSVTTVLVPMGGAVVAGRGANRLIDEARTLRKATRDFDAWTDRLAKLDAPQPESTERAAGQEGSGDPPTP